MKTPKKQKADDPAKVKGFSDQTAKIAELVNKSLVIIKEVGIENKPARRTSGFPQHREMSC